VHEGIREGGNEGIVEGEGEGTSGPDNKCGCNGSGGNIFDNLWQRLLDFITIGLLLSLMSGMYRKKK
ncbi:MAG: hypothetical protein ACP5UA_12985, partial [Candidatus Hydrogenedens sp.]